MFSSSYIDSLCDTMIKMEEHRASNSSIRLQLEESFCSNFVCCGLTLVDLHALLQHYEDVHIRFEEDDDELESMQFKKMQAGAAVYASGNARAGSEPRERAGYDEGMGVGERRSEQDSHASLHGGAAHGLESAKLHAGDMMHTATTPMQRHGHSLSFSSPSSSSSSSHHANSFYRSKRRTLTIGIEPCDFRADSHDISAFDNAVLRRIDPVDAPLVPGTTTGYHSPMTLLPNASHKRFRHSMHFSDTTTTATTPPMMTHPSAHHKHMRHLSYDDNELGALSSSLAPQSTTPSVLPMAAAVTTVIATERAACTLFDYAVPGSAPVTPFSHASSASLSTKGHHGSHVSSSSSSVPSLSSAAHEQATESYEPAGSGLGSYDSDREDRASLHDGSSASDRPYVCPLPGCDKSYKNANGLKYHTQHGHGSDGELIASSAVRESDKPHRCSVAGCGKRYKNSNGLKYHIAHAHSHANRY